jgi:hypothetical protein
MAYCRLNCDDTQALDDMMVMLQLILDNQKRDAKPSRLSPTVTTPSAAMLSTNDGYHGASTHISYSDDRAMPGEDVAQVSGVSQPFKSDLNSRTWPDVIFRVSYHMIDLDLLDKYDIRWLHDPVSLKTSP